LAGAPDIGHTAVPVSALTGQGVDRLLAAIEATVERYFRPAVVRLPYSRGDLLSLFHERGQVDSEEHGADGVEIRGRLPARLLPYFADFVKEGKGGKGG
jgi:GTP-binding protein HflX